MENSTLTCEGCKAKCCRYVTIEINEPKNREDYEEILWYFLHEGVEVFIENGKWNVLFNSKCKGLDKNWKCSIYEKRPKVCRDHDIEDCERHGKDDSENIYFKNYQEFIAYLMDKGIELREIDELKI